MLRTVFALACLAISPIASAADFIVDTTSDAVLDGCDPNLADDCSLRGAITATNASPAADHIAFALLESDPGYQVATAHWRIAPATGFPTLTGGPLTIDGYTQAGASPSTNPPLSAIVHALRIELRGPDPSSVNCLEAFSGVTVRGLALNNCRAAIFLFESGAHVVEGNYIGTDITGQNASPNRFGVALAGDVRIGGTLPEQGNVISGNQAGALVQFRPITRLRVQGNILGPDNLQIAVPGRQDYGVQLNGPVADAVIGGSTAAEANVISGNGFNAIFVSDQPQATAGAPQLRVVGNIIGASFSGVPMGNGLNPGSPSQVLPAIQIGRLGYCRVEIGGTLPGEGNLIAHSGGAGVAVNSCWSAPILGNAFLANRTQPIDLATTNSYDGATPNDPGDADGSSTDPFNAYAGNRLQNTAEVVSEIRDAGADELRLTLQVDSTTTASSYPLRIDFYHTDESGIQSSAVTASYDAIDAQMPREYVLTLSQFEFGGAIAVTDAEGNSSEMLSFGDVFSDGFE